MGQRLTESSMHPYEEEEWVAFNSLVAILFNLLDRQKINKLVLASLNFSYPTRLEWGLTILEIDCFGPNEW